MRHRRVLLLAVGILAVAIVVVLGATVIAVGTPVLLAVLAVIVLVVGLLPRSRRRAQPGADAIVAQAAADSPCASPVSDRRWTTHWDVVPPGAVGLTRAKLSGELAEWGLPREQVEAVLVVIGELLSNATEHGRPPVQLNVTMSGDRVHVAVHDTGPEGPQELPLDPQRLRGRGLQLVEAVSSEWGWTRDPTGKTVWTSLSAQPPP